MSYRATSVMSYGSESPSLVTRLDDLNTRTMDSPMTNDVIQAFQSVSASPPVARRASVGGTSRGGEAPLMRYSSAGPTDMARHGTLRHITIGEVSREPSGSPNGRPVASQRVDNYSARGGSQPAPRRSMSRDISPIPAGLGATAASPLQSSAFAPGMSPEVAAEWARQGQERPVNAVTREEVLAHHQLDGLRPVEYAPVRQVIRSVIPRDPPQAPFPVPAEDVDDQGRHPEQRWAPAVRMHKAIQEGGAPSVDSFDRTRLNSEALDRLQQRLTHRAGRGDDYDDGRTPEQQQGDGAASRGSPMHQQPQQPPQRNEMTNMEVPGRVRAAFEEIVVLLSTISRRRQVPDIPPHALHAFYRRVYQGAYFVKFPERGSPHQRFFRLHVVHNEIYGRQPYLEYASHADAVSVKGRVHLAHLAGLNAGVSNGPSFARFITRGSDGKDMLRGPIFDMERTNLEPDFAFTVVFVNTQQRELFSLLTLDNETFHCWLLVLQFLATINVHVDDTRPGQPPQYPPEVVAPPGAELLQAASMAPRKSEERPQSDGADDPEDFRSPSSRGS